MNDPKHDAAWHGTMTAQPKPTAALNLRTAAQLSNQWALYQGRVTGETDLSRFHAEFDRWLAEHDAQVLRDAAKAIGHAPGCHPDPDRDPYVGCECRISLIYAHADRVAGGAT